MTIKQFHIKRLGVFRAAFFVDFLFPKGQLTFNMEETEQTEKIHDSRKELLQFRESFEAFNKIINDLQRQYLSLEKEYREQGRELGEINYQLRRTIADNRAVTSFLNSILISLTSGVIAVDQGGIITHFNPAAERITGITIDRALGHKYDEVITAKNGGNFSALDTVLSSAEFDSEEKVIINNCGEEIPVSVSTSLLSHECGESYGAVEIFFDLTKTKKLEDEVTRVKTLAALGEMAATVAHEVRNPLGGIGGFAALLKRELEGDEAKTQLVDKIITGVNILNQTVTALLDYTRRDQLSLHEVSLARLIEESVEYECTDRGDYQSAVQVEVKVEDRDLRLKCDPHLMRQVLLNLLRNGREAMPLGGRITVRATRLTEDKALPISSPTVAIEVQDTGEGIPEDIRDKIFRPFFSTKHKNNGSGLGLASVWKTVQAHGGNVSVSSEVGKGSTFRIVLPVNR